MSYLENRANWVMLRYADARPHAVLQDGVVAIYFIGGSKHGECYTSHQGFDYYLAPLMRVGDEVYRLKIFRERLSPMYKYPFYVLKEQV